MKPVGLCSDHAGFELKEYLKSRLEALGIAYTDYGTYTSDSCDYADFAHRLAIAIETEACTRGIAVCGSGNGINMALNKHQTIRAALCWNEEIARLARLHNNANVLVLPGRFVTPSEADRLLDVFLTGDFEGGRHQQRIDKIPVSQ